MNPFNFLLQLILLSRCTYDTCKLYIFIYLLKWFILKVNHSIDKSSLFRFLFFFFFSFQYNVYMYIYFIYTVIFMYIDIIYILSLQFYIQFCSFLSLCLFLFSSAIHIARTRKRHLYRGIGIKSSSVVAKS